MIRDDLSVSYAFYRWQPGSVKPAFHSSRHGVENDHSAGQGGNGIMAPPFCDFGGAMKDMSKYSFDLRSLTAEEGGGYLDSFPDFNEC
jgi:hypothetical protein